MFTHKSTGTIIYDPYRGAMQRRTTNWCIVNVDKGITDYYRWWLRYQRHIYLQPPSWDAHISIVRGEKINDDKLKAFWKKYQNQRVGFTYQHVGDFYATRSKYSQSQDDGTYYCVDIQCSFLDDIRDELGLRTGFKYHLTFGRTYEYEARKPKTSKR